MRQLKQVMNHDRLSTESLSDEGTASVNDHRVAANDINLLLMGFQYYLLGYRAKSPQATAASDNHFANSLSYDITFYLHHEKG